MAELGHGMIGWPRAALTRWVMAALVGLFTPAYAADDYGDVTVLAEATVVPKPSSTTKEPATTQPRVFEPSFFEQFAPRTAADMVRELPGFNVQSFGGGGRGLGQGGLNVLINGARVSGKQTDSMDILRRTPANAVTQIVITDASRMGITGFSGPIADVRLIRDTTSYTLEWSPTFRRGLGPSLLDASAAVTGGRGPWSYTLGIQNDNRWSGNKGPEKAFDPDGTLIETRDEDQQRVANNPTLNTVLTYQGEEGLVVNFNTSFGTQDSDFDELRKGTVLDTGAQTARGLESDNNNRFSEISGDVAFPVGSGQFKLIGLQTTRQREGVSTTREFNDFGFSDFDEASRRVRETESGETIFRGELSWPNALGGSIELAAERAFNFLDTEAATLTLDADDLIIGEPDPDDPTRVEERRNEYTIAYARALTKKLSLQSSVGADIFELSQPNDPDVEARALTRLKGALNLTYALNQDTDLRYRLERRQGQLNFGDFVFSQSQDDGTVSAGNDDIVPQQSWYNEIEFERRIGSNSLVTLSAYREDLEEVVDRIPFDTDEDGVIDADGPGNIDSALRFGARAEATINLTNAGIRGGELQLRASGQETEVEDPFTGDLRDLNNARIYDWRVEFRQQVPNTALEYAFGANDERRSSRYRFNQYEREYQGVFGFASVTHRNVAGAEVRVSLSNLFSQVQSFDRIAFDTETGGRAAGNILFIEERDRTYGPILRLRVRKTL